MHLRSPNFVFSAKGGEVVYMVQEKVTPGKRKLYFCEGNVVECSSASDTVS